MGKWEEKHHQNVQSTFQAYLDYQSPSYAALQQEIYTLDFDYQMNWKADGRHDVTWGTGVRYIADHLTGSESITIVDYADHESIFSAFLQDQIAIAPKEVYLTLGSKFEHNTLSGFEIEPSARIAWYPAHTQTVWAAVSRAVRTPSIGESSMINSNAVSLAPGAVAQQQFHGHFASEELGAYEIGYRVKPIRKVSIDSTAFVNDYRRLRTFEPGDPLLTPDGVYSPYSIANRGAGHAYGCETSANWDVTPRWSLLANYSYINLVLDQGASQDPTFMGKEGEAPHHQFSIRSQWFLPHDVRLINAAYYVDTLPTDAVDRYVRFDTQVIWRAMNGVEFALVRQNLLENTYPAFGAPPNGTVNEIPRAFYGRVTLRCVFHSKAGSWPLCVMSKSDHTPVAHWQCAQARSPNTFRGSRVRIVWGLM